MTEHEPREVTRAAARGRRRRLGRMLAPLAVLLLVVGAWLADEGGAAGAVGLVALAQGIGLAVAVVSFLLGHNPLSKE